jgi:hypothetical protein
MHDVVLAAFPAMPTLTVSGAAMIVYTALMVTLAAGFLAYWTHSPAERRIGPALPILLVGGAVSGLMEAWLDSVVLVAYPPHQSLPVLHAFGRSVPIFVPIGYAWFCGGLVYLVARSFQGGVTSRKVWALYGAIAVVDFVAIGLSSWIGILRFYGHPPLEILGYPLWWAGIDGLDVVLGGAIVFALLPRLRGRGNAWLVLVPSVALGAAAGIVGWPISTALSSGWSTAAKYACAVASLCLSLACVSFLARSLPALASYLAAPDRERPASAITSDNTTAEDHDAPSTAGTPVGAVRW